MLAAGKHGVLYEKNSDSLAEKIKATEADPAHVADLRRMAPERIKERFTWELITDEYEALFRKWSDAR